MPIQWLHKTEESAVMHSCNFVKYHITRVLTHANRFLRRTVDWFFCALIGLFPDLLSLRWRYRVDRALIHTSEISVTLAIWLADLSPPSPNWSHPLAVAGSQQLPTLTAAAFAFGKLWKTMNTATADLRVRNIWYGDKNVPGRPVEASLIANWLYSHWAVSIRFFGNWLWGPSKWCYSLPASYKADIEIGKEASV